MVLNTKGYYAMMRSKQMSVDGPSVPYKSLIIMEQSHSLFEGLNRADLILSPPNKTIFFLSHLYNN